MKLLPGAQLPYRGPKTPLLNKRCNQKQYRGRESVKSNSGRLVRGGLTYACMHVNLKNGDFKDQISSDQEIHRASCRQQFLYEILYKNCKNRARKPEA